MSIRIYLPRDLRSRAEHNGHMGERLPHPDHEERIRAHEERVAREWDHAAARCRQTDPSLTMPERRRTLLRLLEHGPLMSVELRTLTGWSKVLLDKTLHTGKWFQCDKPGSRYARWSLTEAGRLALAETR